MLTITPPMKVEEFTQTNDKLNPSENFYLVSINILPLVEGVFMVDYHKKKKYHQRQR
jgi:general stress protein CsbA